MTDLRVVPNPYAAIDHLGRPAGAVLALHLNGGKFRDDPKNPNPAKRWAPRPYVGATVQSSRLSADRNFRIKGRAHTVPGKFDHAWSHSLDVQTVQVAENTEMHFYYMRAIKDGSLHAADLETWLAAQLPREHFQPPEIKLQHAKEGAIAQWIAAHHAEKLAAHNHHDASKRVALTESLGAGVDPRLDTLVMHFADQVKQSHPVGIAIEAQKAAEAKAKAKAAADAAKAAEPKAAADLLPSTEAPKAASPTPPSPTPPSVAKPGKGS